MAFADSVAKEGPIMRHALLTILAGAAGLGCTAMPKMPAKLADMGPASKTVSHIVLSADQMQLEKDGMPHHQGMLCRAYFFPGSDEIPVRISGDVVFTYYDMANGEQSEPVGKYGITPEMLPGHYRKDVVGHSYVFWLPCEPPAKTKMRVVAAFHSASCPPVASKPVEVELMPLKQQLAKARKKGQPIIGANFEVIKSSTEFLTTQASDVAGWDGGAKPIARALPAGPSPARTTGVWVDPGLLPPTPVQPSTPSAAPNAP
jgi:hypothetical protein